MKVILLTEIAEENMLLNRLKIEATEADKAVIAVSFINSAGLTHLVSKLKPLLEAGHSVAIFTSGYLRITEPKALQRLLKLTSTFDSLKVFFNPNDRFHAKFLLFEKPNRAYTLFLGSSNITLQGLGAAGELNVQISGKSSDEVFKSVKIVIANLASDTSFKELDGNLIDEYEQNYELARKRNKATEKRHHKKNHPSIFHLPPPQTMRIYTVHSFFNRSEKNAIESDHPKWGFYLNYLAPLTSLKKNDLFLLISKIRGGKKTVSVAKYFEFDKVESVGRIAHVTKGNEVSLERLKKRLGTRGNMLEHNGKLDIVDELIIRRDFREIFP